MPAYLIAGLPGTGKSTVIRELTDRGYATIDGDDDAKLSGFVCRKTGLMAGRHLTEGTAMEDYMWGWDEGRVRNIISSAGDRPLFLGGNAGRIHAFYQLFPKVFALVMNNETLAEHLEKRIKGFGSAPAERQRIISWNTGYELQETEAGAILIPVSVQTTPHDVAETILTEVESTLHDHR